MRKRLTGLLVVAALLSGCTDGAGAEHDESDESDEEAMSSGRAIGAVLTPPMAFRCGRYLVASGRGGLADVPACGRAINDVWIAVEPTDEAVIFTRELSVLLASEETGLFLTDLGNALSERQVGNLWDWTLEHRVVRGDKAKAMKWLGVLFHADGRTMEAVRFQFRTTRGQLLFDVYQLLLGAITDKEIDVFPAGVEGRATVLYHFYTIGYLAQRLRDDGTPGLLAFLAPYLLNETYERISSFGNALASAGKPGVDGTLNVSDVYLGYAGAAFALDGEPRRFRGLSFAQFKGAYASDPFSTIAQGLDPWMPPGTPGN